MQLRKLLTLLVGLVLVAGASAFGLVHAHERAHSLTADQAVLESDLTVVGTPFAGSVSKIHVAPGDTVTAGQPLVQLQSPTLQQARETSRFNDEGVGYRMQGDDTIVFEASAAGIVGPMPFGVGSFIPANTEITHIQLADSMRLRAAMPMEPDDYGRMSLGSTVEVTLPNGDAADAQIYDITFDEAAQSTSAIVLARSGDLSAGGAFLNGSPVLAELELASDGVGAWAATELASLLTPKGTDR